MKHFVYLLVSSNKKKTFSYVGYTNDIKKRVTLHNRGKGAKFTRGKKWKLIYHKEYSSKQRAMQEEYKLKNNYKLRKLIKIKNGF
tara:strand:- start:688 stop:942 length:255 start_codon:yes stop_codon:yes gene_type:complete